MRGKLKIACVLGALLLLVAMMVTCQNKEEAITSNQVYFNHNDTVKYVGIETCQQCHQDIYESFVQTGMGSSFGLATQSKSSANFSGIDALYDSARNFYYQPHWKRDSLKLLEFRLMGADTVYHRLQNIHYVVGSGQHTNSHLFTEGSYLYQAPFTWYSQKQKLDLPPGFENGHNSRFSRKIGLECTSCHNAMPVHFEIGSINSYKQVPKAIDCERCHGPGEAHVKKIRAGNITDTSRAIDYSIVNIKKLSTELQFEACMRCHLQGNAVLAPGKSFFDFKPGMKLNSVMDVYLPRYEGADDEFIMASHVDRFKQSKCFIESSKTFNCTSCHNPHVSVKVTASKQFNSTCAGCHAGKPKHQCTQNEDSLKLANYNCVSCHMPSSGSIDIPHVSVHDHRIQIPRKRKDTTGIKRFLGLQAVNNTKPTMLSKAKAYLQQYERFETKSYYLDSAQYFLERAGAQKENIAIWVHFWHLKNDVLALRETVKSTTATGLLNVLTRKTFSNSDAWTAYRLALVLGNEEAKLLLERAVELAPLISEFRVKLGDVLIALGSLEEGKQCYLWVLKMEPNNATANNNVGFLFLQQNKLDLARLHLKRAVALNPDYELTWLNKASLYLMEEEFDKAKTALYEVLRINPNSVKAKAGIEYLQTKQ